MKVKTLIKYLQELDPNYDVCLTRLFLMTIDKEEYEVILDNPIAGLGQSDDNKEARFLLTSDILDKKLKNTIKKHFGKVKRIK